MSAPSAEAREWHRTVRVAVRECLETWTLQAKGGPVTVEALETILARATIPILPPVRRATARAGRRVAGVTEYRDGVPRSRDDAGCQMSLRKGHLPQAPAMHPASPPGCGDVAAAPP